MVFLPACPVGDLPDIDKASRNISGTKHMDRVYYNCDLGHEFPDQTSQISVQCMWDNTWTDAAFTACTRES